MHTLLLLIINQYADRSGDYKYMFIEKFKILTCSCFSVVFCKGMTGMIMEPAMLLEHGLVPWQLVLSPSSRKC